MRFRKLLSGKVIAGAALVLSLILTRTAVAVQIFGFYTWPPVCRATHWYSEKELAYFFPPYFLPLIEPYTRIATEDFSFSGPDPKGAPYKIFGSTGRSIPMDHQLANYLYKEGLINIEQDGSYHFKSPWRTEKLSELGIRYVIQKNGLNLDLVKAGWEPKGQLGSAFIYENPVKPGIVYYRKGNDQISLAPGEVKFEGNIMEAVLPPIEEETEFIITLSIRPGWKASVDGKDRALSSGENRMMRITARPGDRILRLRYEPYRTRDFILYALASIFAACLCWFAAGLLSKKSRSDRS